MSKPRVVAGSRQAEPLPSIYPFILGVSHVCRADGALRAQRFYIWMRFIGYIRKNGTIHLPRLPVTGNRDYLRMDYGRNTLSFSNDIQAMRIEEGDETWDDFFIHLSFGNN